jgi:dTDP-4-dehydrorhamnose 3,5-epimerase
MRFIETPLAGAWLVIPEPHVDARGFFARSCCSREFASHGLCERWVQFNISVNERRGTLRGLHYSLPTIQEVKLVRCTSGAIFDVIVDIRPDSPTCGQWFAVELNAENRHAVYVPVGFAHGFQTLDNHSEVFYQMGDFYDPEASRGIRYDDASIGVRWPIPNPILSPRDEEHPLLADAIERGP